MIDKTSSNLPVLLPQTAQSPKIYNHEGTILKHLWFVATVTMIIVVLGDFMTADVGH